MQYCYWLKKCPKAIISFIMIHVERCVKLYEELTIREIDIMMNQCYMTSQTDQKLSVTWTSIWLHLARFSNKKMTRCFCILAPGLKTVVIIIIIKKHTIRCLFCLSLSLFSLRRLLYASYKNKKSSVATNFYLHCNITFCVFQKGVRKAEGRREEGKERGE